MSLIQTPWTSQPQQAVGIDWSNPITRGLLDAWLPQSLPYRSANGRRPTVTGAINLAVGSLGIGAFAASSSIRYDVGTFGQSGTFCTVVVAGFKSYGSTASVVRRDGATTPVQVANNSVRSVGWTPVNTTNGYFGTSPGEKVGVFIANRESQSTERLYFNGSNVATASSFTGYGSTANPLCFLGNESNSELLTSSIGLFYGAITWTRALSESEIRSISQNPWQIFKPLPRRIFVPVSAATGDGTGTGSLYGVTLSFPTGTASGTGAVNGTGTGALSSSSLASPTALAAGSALATGSLSAVSTTAPSATATGSALATGALATVTLTTITAAATGSALATGSLDAIDLSTVSGSATGTTAGNATGVGAVTTIALSAPSASAVGSALATGGFSHISLSAVSGTASAATNGQATADLQPISISAPLAIAIASSVATGGVQSIGLTAPNATATGQAQTIARPSTDTSNSGWTPSTGSDLYAMIDEVTPDDADYISTNSAGSVCRLGLGAVADPGTSSGQVVSYRASSSTGNGLRVELMQGGTVIATWNHSTLPATDTTYQQSLSAAECDAITDYTALSVRLTSL